MYFTAYDQLSDELGRGNPYTPLLAGSTARSKSRRQCICPRGHWMDSPLHLTTALFSTPKAYHFRPARPPWGWMPWPPACEVVYRVLLWWEGRMADGRVVLTATLAFCRSVPLQRPR